MGIVRSGSNQLFGIILHIDVGWEPIAREKYTCTRERRKFRHILYCFGDIRENIIVSPNGILFYEIIKRIITLYMCGYRNAKVLS